jgi:hypothetical protein
VRCGVTCGVPCDVTCIMCDWVSGHSVGASAMQRCGMPQAPRQPYDTLSTRAKTCMRAKRHASCKFGETGWSLPPPLSACALPAPRSPLLETGPLSAMGSGPPSSAGNSASPWPRGLCRHCHVPCADTAEAMFTWLRQHCLHQGIQCTLCGEGTGQHLPPMPRIVEMM